jgi:hypothetical protein
MLVFTAAAVIAFYMWSKQTFYSREKFGEKSSLTSSVENEPVPNIVKATEDLDKKRFTDVHDSDEVWDVNKSNHNKVIDEEGSGTPFTHYNENTPYLPVISKTASKSQKIGPYWSFQEVKKNPVEDASRIYNEGGLSIVPIKHKNEFGRTRSYSPWSKEEDEELIKECEEGKSIKEIALYLQRNEGGIRARINKLYEYR